MGHFQESNHERNQKQGLGLNMKKAKSLIEHQEQRKFYSLLMEAENWHLLKVIQKENLQDHLKTKTKDKHLHYLIDKASSESLIEAVGRAFLGEFLEEMFDQADEPAKEMLIMELE